MLTQATLAILRARMTASFPDTAVLLSRVGSDDGQGGETVAWTAGASYACRLIQDARPTDVVEGEQTNAIHHRKCLLPWDCPVTGEHRLRIGGVDYEVISATGDKSERTCVVATVWRPEPALGA